MIHKKPSLGSFRPSHLSAARDCINHRLLSTYQDFPVASLDNTWTEFPEKPACGTLATKTDKELAISEVRLTSRLKIRSPKGSAIGVGRLADKLRLQRTSYGDFWTLWHWYVSRRSSSLQYSVAPSDFSAWYHY